MIWWFIKKKRKQTVTRRLSWTYCWVCESVGYSSVLFLFLCVCFFFVFFCFVWGFYPLAFQAEGILLLPVSVQLSVRPSVPLCQFMAEDIPPPVLNQLAIRYLVNLLVRIKEPSSPTGWKQSPQPQTEDTKKSRKPDCVATGFIWCSQFHCRCPIVHP